MPPGLNAPDLIEPLLGFRAWVLGPHGSLEAVTARSSWDRGENVASCPVGDHADLPGSDCICGLYALHDVADPRLNPAIYVIGSIAAWGNVEIYRTGFRAEKAMVLALSYHPRMSSGSGRRLRMASQFYDVKVVNHRRLVEYSLKFAQPLDRAHLPGGRGTTLGDFGARRATRPAPSAPPAPPSSIKAPYRGPGRRISAAKAGPQGIWVPHHVWSRPIGSGKRMRIGVTPAFAGLFPRDPRTRIHLAAIGSEVARGDVVAVLHTRTGPLAVRTPHSGWVAEHNPDLPSTVPIKRAPTGAGWILSVRAEAGEDTAALAAGPHGEASYEAYVRRLGGDAALIASLRPDQPWPPPAVPLDPGRNRPFGDHAAIADLLLPVLQDRIDPAICRALAAFAERVVIEVSDPRAGVTLRSMGGVMGIGEVAEVSEQAGPPTGTPEEIRLRMDGLQLDQLFRGDLDLPRALGAAEVELLGGSRENAVLAFSVLRRLFPAYRERSDEMRAGRLQGLGALARERERRARIARGRMRSA